VRAGMVRNYNLIVTLLKGFQNKKQNKTKKPVPGSFGAVLEPFGAVKNVTINVTNKILET